MESALEWQLKLITWEFFVTLTWHPAQIGTHQTRRRHVTRWLDQWAKREGLESLECLATVVRWERGELGGYPHCHILVARFPARAISRHTCFRQIHLWKRGLARVRLYNPACDTSAAYMCKGKFSAHWAQGANAYELRKFDNADAIYINSAAQTEMFESRTTGRRMSPVDYAHSP